MVAEFFLRLNAENPLLLGLIRVLFVVIAILSLVPPLIWWERRLLSWMQDRIGPNRSGTITFPDSFPLKGLAGKKVRTFGLIQPLLDGLKLFLKEDITPNSVDRKIYFIAPAIALFPAFALGATLPWGPSTGLYGILTPVADVEIGILYVLAISSLGAYGIVLAGYASNNKYSMMGALRASAQLISYELAMAMSVAAIIMATGSMKLTQVVSAQEEPLWGVVPWAHNWFILTPFGLISAIIFLIAVIAETNRAPFDLPEAENELIAGYHTEYSSMKFAVFFMGEYAAMFIFSGVFATLFLGGYNILPIDWSYLAATTGNGFFKMLAGANYWLAPLVFLGKCFMGITFFIWLRATLPRLRYDQLMDLGWKSMLPIAVANFIVVGLWIICTTLYGAGGGWIAAIAAMILFVILYLNILNTSRKANPATATRSITMVKSPTKTESP
ncbi:MAG: NADH-quinone oxidoreductase subunit H [Fimbriimonadaceae bacterium]|nr:NADH-quinone oxidoreductase subunit H [Fimbriimonadaceae bacterium]